MKDRECISCIHFLMCKGKPTPAPCVNYEKRKVTKDGRRKVDKDNNGCI